jgi:hypothetical protein
MNRRRWRQLMLARRVAAEHDLVALAATLHAHHQFRMVNNCFLIPVQRTGTFASIYKESSVSVVWSVGLRFRPSNCAFVRTPRYLTSLLRLTFPRVVHAREGKRSARDHFVLGISSCSSRIHKVPSPLVFIFARFVRALAFPSHSLSLFHRNLRVYGRFG